MREVGKTPRCHERVDVGLDQEMFPLALPEGMEAFGLAGDSGLAKALDPNEAGLLERLQIARGAI